MTKKIYEMQKFLTLYPISQVRLLTSSETLRVLVQEIEIPERLSVLKTAVNMTAIGEESEFFSALWNTFMICRKESLLNFTELLTRLLNH